MVRRSENLLASWYPSVCRCFLVPFSFPSLFPLLFLVSCPCVAIVPVSLETISFVTFSRMAPLIHTRKTPFRWNGVLTKRNETPLRCSTLNKLVFPWTMTYLKVPFNSASTGTSVRIGLAELMLVGICKVNFSIRCPMDRRFLCFPEGVYENWNPLFGGAACQFCWP